MSPIVLQTFLGWGDPAVRSKTLRIPQLPDGGANFLLCPRA
jgi:hypothetical protein